MVSGAGWWGGMTLIVFFATATALSKLRTSRSTSMRQQRGSQRDAVQVLANGAVPAVLALVAIATDNSIWILAAMCAIAAATADTWATEVGRLTGATPRSIISLKLVPVGTSGAVSVPGTIASLAGGVAIGGFVAFGIAAGWLDASTSWKVGFVTIAFAGLAGSLLDSGFGATVQETFRCDTCNETTESRGRHTTHVVRRNGGIPGINNDVVNLASTLIPAVVVVLVG
jgi:uncharacterized protein (TIGR00297 family)